MLFFMMAFRFSVLLQLSSCTYVYNYFSENARIKFIPIDADVSGVMMAYFCFIFQFPNLICYGLVDWLIRYQMTAVVTVVFTSCPTWSGQQQNQFREILSKQPHTHLLQAQQTLALLIYVRFKDVSAMKVT